MKRILISLFTVAFVFMFVVTNVSAQGLTAKGFLGGINMANVYGDDVEMEGIKPSNQMGFAAGAFLVYNFGENLGIRPEVLYSQKGAKYEEGEAKVTLKVDYLEIPILIQFAIPTEGSLKPILLAGPYVGIKMSAKTVMEIGDQSSEEDMGDEVKSTDFGLMFGAGVVFSDRFEISARYSMGFTSIPDVEIEDVDLKNKAIQIRAGISL